MAGPTCPDPAVAAALGTQLAAKGQSATPFVRVNAAVARVRATRALGQARRLYTRTNFAGCIALLSISEIELGRALADADLELQQRSHQLLAQVLLWLGICQWASGEPQAAGASFARSSQLPESPTPDPRLLPPELINAYRSAVSAPRPEVDCLVDPPLSVSDLLVDGRGPIVAGSNRITVPAGSHYLVLKSSCRESSRCPELSRQLGPDGMRSLRLEAETTRCRIQLPAVPSTSRLSCISLQEADDLSFLAEVTRAAQAGRTLVVAVSGDRVALRLLRAGSASFRHQLVSSGQPPAQVVARSGSLLIGEEGAAAGPVTQPTGPPGHEPWYAKWWVWAVAGGAVLTVIVSTAVAVSASDRVKVVFGP